MTASPLPRVGDVVSGKYRIESVIGEGGMGVVLGAIDTSLNRPVAIKFLTPARAANEAAAERFQREARAAASIQSEHVVRVYEVGALANGAPFIVMEHLRGSDLAHVVAARGGLPVHEASDFVLQACEALGEAHARGIVHRDLKPQNLFLTQRNDGSPCVKVLDFGISKTLETDEGGKKLTSTDMVMGTPLYMSPEQVRSLKNVDARADVWALGAILHELLAAAPPFDGPSASALHAAIAMDPPTPLRALRPDAPVELEAVVARCLEKKPADRYQDVGALATALAPFASDRGRTSADRIGDVVRAAKSSDSSVTSTPSGEAPTLPIGMASTLHATPPAGATDGAWEQKPAPKPPSGIRAGVIGAAVFLVGGGALVGYALRTEPQPVATTMPIPTAAATLPTTASIAEPPPVVSVVVPPVVSVVDAAPAAAPRRVAIAAAAPAAAPSSEPPNVIPALAHKAPGQAEFERRQDQDGERLRAERRQWDDNERICNEQRASLAREPTNEHAARTAAGWTCRYGNSSRCQLDVCLKACEILQDEDCLRLARVITPRQRP